MIKASLPNISLSSASRQWLGKGKLKRVARSRKQQTQMGENQSEKVRLKGGPHMKAAPIYIYRKE
ncbi:MAG: hypothetical protein DLM69_06070 [Candidatus Chloroheliales bacterium]|nr:MAG: hypothetical protein DLM69_06070 [Chloroflexota bacterium]